MSLFRDTLNKVLLGDIMTKDVIFVYENDRFSLVEKRLREHHIRHLPVLSRKGKLVGIITQRDFFAVAKPRINMDGERFYQPEALDEIILKYVMKPDPFVLFPDSTIIHAMIMMAERKYGCVPIISKETGELVGIVTKGDVIRRIVGIASE